MQHGPIHHVLSRLRVVDSLRSPYTLQILLTWITFLYIDNGVGPVDQVGRFQQNHGTVGTPSIGWNHICHYHIESLAILATKDMRVTDSPGGADDFRVDYRFIIIQCPVGITVHAYSIAHSLFIATIPSEISEQISYIIFFGKGFLPGISRKCKQRQ